MEICGQPERGRSTRERQAVMIDTSHPVMRFPAILAQNLEDRYQPPGGQDQEHPCRRDRVPQQRGVVILLAGRGALAARSPP